MESETSSKCFEFSLLCLNKITLLLLMILLFCWCLVTLCFQAKTEWWWYTFCYTRNYWTKQKQKAVISSWKSVRSTYKKDHFLSTRIGNQKFPVRMCHLCENIRNFLFKIQMNLKKLKQRNNKHNYGCVSSGWVRSWIIMLSLFSRSSSFLR